MYGWTKTISFLGRTGNAKSLYLPKFEGVKKSQFFVRRTYDNIIEKREKLQQGHAYTITFRLVCKKCNETWMSQIEDAVKPILIPVLQGSPLDLTPQKCTELAIWIALKVIVTEQSTPEDAVLQQYDRTEFMKTRQIPDGLKIWITMHDSERWYSGLFFKTGTMYLGLSPPPTGRFKNIQSTAFGIGHVFSYSLINRVPNFNLNIAPLYAGRIARIWPPGPASIPWPISPLFLPEINRVATFLDELGNAPFSTWLPFPNRW